MDDAGSVAYVGSVADVVSAADVGSVANVGSGVHSVRDMDPDEPRNI